MIKRILSLALAIILVASLSVVAVSAAENTKIYFEVPETWLNYSRVYCHIWEYGGDSLSAWQSRKQICTQVKDNFYEYDVSKVGGLADGVYYGVIFSVDIGLQTFDLLMSTQCMGCTAYCTGDFYISPGDASRTIEAAFWRGVDPAKYGPILNIGPFGDIQGTCIAPDKTAVSVLTDFIDSNLDYASTYRNEAPCDIINRLGAELGLNEMEIAQAVYDAMIPVPWDYPENFVPTEPATRDEVPPEIIVDNTVVTFPEEEDKESFTYYVNLKTPNKIEDVQATIRYDRDVLEFVNCEAPNLINPVINPRELGYIYFNAVDVIDGMDFTEDALLIKVEFKIIGSGEAEIGFTMEEMTEFYGVPYYRNSEQLVEGIVITEGILGSEVPSSPVEDATGITDKAEKPADIVHTGADNVWLLSFAFIIGIAVIIAIRKKIAVLK